MIILQKFLANKYSLIYRTDTKSSRLERTNAEKHLYFLPVDFAIIRGSVMEKIHQYAELKTLGKKAEMVGFQTHRVQHHPFHKYY